MLIFYHIIYKLRTIKGVKTYHDLFTNVNRYFYGVKYFEQGQILYAVKITIQLRLVYSVCTLIHKISQNLLGFLYSIVIAAYLGTLHV